MSLFRCPSRFGSHHCEGWRWHPEAHHATWTWWPFDAKTPAERRTTEWTENPLVERRWAVEQIPNTFPTLGIVSEGSDPSQGRTAVEAEPTPLMKAHLALLRYGRHERSCPWSYPPIGGSVCNCGLAEAIRKSCTNIEAEH